LSGPVYNRAAGLAERLHQPPKKISLVLKLRFTGQDNTPLVLRKIIGHPIDDPQKTLMFTTGQLGFHHKGGVHASAFKTHGFIAQPVIDGNPGRSALNGGFHQPIGDPDPMVLFEPTAGIGQHLPGLVMVNIDAHRFQQFKGGGVERFDLLRCQQLISWNVQGFESADPGFGSFILQKFLLNLRRI